MQQTVSKTIRSVNPNTGNEIRSFPEMTSAEIQMAVDRSSHAFHEFRKTSFAERAEILNRVADILEKEREEWGQLMSLEMGKLKQPGIDEVLKCAKTCRYYAENGAAMLANKRVTSTAQESYAAYHPLGIILAVMPWNFPFWQVLRFAAPTLMAGNAILLKHASNVPQCALAIEEILARAGLPKGVFQTLLISSGAVEPLLKDPRIAAVTLTGSDAAGAKVAASAGAHLKKAVLELGGSDPFIVMPSVNLEETAVKAVAARIVNNGQSCVSAKRFIVHEQIAGPFQALMVEALRKLKVGSSLDPTTQLGPLASEEMLTKLHHQVECAIADGAKLVTGGKRREGPGYFYEPSLLTDIPETSAAYREEFFGPVALFFRAKDLAHAISIANDSPFGLGASLWSKDPKEHSEFIRDIEAGMAFINAPVASSPQLPFGGVKRSGYGRELGEFGIHEFVNIKTVWVQ